MIRNMLLGMAAQPNERAVTTKAFWQTLLSRDFCYGSAGRLRSDRLQVYICV
jgi:hypothetical protein